MTVLDGQQQHQEQQQMKVMCFLSPSKQCRNVSLFSMFYKMAIPFVISGATF